MKLLHALLTWHHRPTSVAAPADADAGSAPAASEDKTRPGCGWFDSSHDLRAGLQVREHAANDAVCAELPLDLWLGLQRA